MPTLEYLFADFGTVKVKNGVVTFKDATFAPGIWAGMEGAPVEITGPEGSVLTKITAVDFERRELRVDTNKTVSIWSTITPWYEITVIDGRGPV